VGGAAVLVAGGSLPAAVPRIPPPLALLACHS
jgi:hypothetical protein